MFGNYLALAYKSLRKRGLRTFLTILGIVIGIAAVVSLISLGGALRDAITGQFSSIGADTLFVQSAGTGFGPPGSSSPRPITEKDLELIRDTPGVRLAIPNLIRLAEVEFSDITVFNGLNSLPRDEEELDAIYESSTYTLDSGRLLETSDRGKVVVGYGFATREEYSGRLRVGSRLTIQSQSFEIAGILKQSSSIFLNEDILMFEDELKDLLDIHDEIDLIVVRVNEGEDIEVVSERIQRRLRNERDVDLGEEDFSVQTPLQSIAAISNVLTIINVIFFGIASISLLVGGIGIANTMYTSVLERKKDIGVMKAIGARNKDILFIFLVESGLVGLVGGIIGVVAGLALAFGVTSIVGAFLGGIVLQAQLSPLLIILAIAFSFLIGGIAGILPAMRASRLKPVEAFKR